MKLDGYAICYILSRQFPDVASYVRAHRSVYDFPLLYDEDGSHEGHCVVVPSHVMLDSKTGRRDAIYICLSEQSAQFAVNAGLSVIHIRGGMTEQQVLNKMLTTYMGHLNLDTQLRTYIDAYAGFQPLISACAKAMGCSCALVDRHFRIVCQADEEKGAESSWLADSFDLSDIALFMGAKSYRDMRTSRKVFAAPGFDGVFLCNVFANDMPVGMLAFAHDGAVLGARYVRFLIQYLTPFVEEMYAHLGTFGTTSESASQIKDMLVRAFRGLPYDAKELKETVAREAGQASDRFAVLRFERVFGQEDSGEIDYLAWRVELGWPGAYCVAIDGELYALVDLNSRGRTKHEPLSQGLAQFIRDALVKVGISREFSSFGQLGAAFAQASAALEQGGETDSTYWIYRFGEYAFDWLCMHGGGSAASEHAYHPAIAELARYDEAHGSELLHTLRVFMDSRYNATLAAQSLFVARSTLINRLERIVELTHIDLDDPDERLYLALSLKLQDKGTGRLSY